jgi:hypothetical protein
MKTFQISRVYYVAAESLEAAHAQLTPTSRTCRVDFESIQQLPSGDQSSELGQFGREAVRQLRGLTIGPPQQPEPRRQS